MNMYDLKEQAVNECIRWCDAVKTSIRNYY